MKKRFLIIRHAEAEKTLKGIHGGSGTPLTTQGREDVLNIASYLRNQFSDISANTLICCSFVPQVLETANVISQLLDIPMLKFVELRNMDMGVLAGLSDDEAKQKFPDIMKRLELWRNGKLDEKRLNIPEKEPIDSFLQRIRGVLRECYASDKTNIIIIVTRSIGIGILNLLLKNSELKGQSYRRFRFDPCSLTVIESDVIGYGKLISHNETFFLGRHIEYPDD